MVFGILDSTIRPQACCYRQKRSLEPTALFLAWEASSARLVAPSESAARLGIADYFDREALHSAAPTNHGIESIGHMIHGGKRIAKKLFAPDPLTANIVLASCRHGRQAVAVSHVAENTQTRTPHRPVGHTTELGIVRCSNPARKLPQCPYPSKSNSDKQAVRNDE